MKILVFDIWGDYAHYKKIYATTSAITYVIPPKTSLYGLFWAIGAIKKSLDKDVYLQYFTEKQCKVGIQIVSPIIMQRINTNLRSVLGQMKATDNRKPTMIEYVYKPYYRIFFSHTNPDFYQSLKGNLQEHKSVYTPTLGTGNLIANISFGGEFEVDERQTHSPIRINSVIPKKSFIDFNYDELRITENEIVEQSMVAIEMDTDRNVIERDEILLDRTAKPINATVKSYFTITQYGNIIMF